MTIRGWVSGVVQGVGFRWFVMRQAQRYRLQGWVRNLADGRVEFMAGGGQEQLEDFLQQVRRGPPASRVRDLHYEVVCEEAELGPFGIR